MIVRQDVVSHDGGIFLWQHTEEAWHKQTFPNFGFSKDGNVCPVHIRIINSFDQVTAQVDVVAVNEYLLGRLFFFARVIISLSWYTKLGAKPAAL